MGFQELFLGRFLGAVEGVLMDVSRAMMSLQEVPQVRNGDDDDEVDKVPLGYGWPQVARMSPLYTHPRSLEYHSYYQPHALAPL